MTEDLPTTDRARVALDQRLDEHEELLVELAQRFLEPDEPPDAAPIRWDRLDRTEAVRIWRELGEWVDHLIVRYELTEITPCWFRHGAVVEELTALWTVWRVSFADDAPPQDGLMWHDHLDRARVRIQLWTRDSGCRSAGQHRPGRPPRSAAAADYAAHVDADLATRPLRRVGNDRDGSGQ